MAICVGCGLEVNANGVLQVDRAAANDGCLNCTDGDGLSVRVAPNGGITCTASGLAADLRVNNAGCIGMSGAGTSASPLLISVDRSETSCNGITCQGNGLYSPCPDSLVGPGIFGSVGGGVFPFGISGFQPGVPGSSPSYFDRLSDCTTYPGADCIGGGGGTQVRFTNPTCCTVQGYWEWFCYGGVITGASADFDATCFMTASINNGPYAEEPSTNVKYYGDADKSTFELGGFHGKNYHILGPNPDSFAVSAKFTIFVATGSATWAVGPRFEVYAHFTQTGCVCA